MDGTKAESVLFLVHAGVFWCAGPPQPRASSGRERGAGPPQGWVPLVAGPNPPQPDNAEGGLGEAFVSLFYTLSFQGGEEGKGLKKFLNFNQVWL